MAALQPPVLGSLPDLTKAEEIEVSGQIAAELPDGAAYRLRIYVNEEVRRDVRLPRRETEFSVADVPLVEGTNTISATIAGPADETAHSAPRTVELDATAPAIVIESPKSGGIVYGESLLLSGTTEPGATVDIVDSANGARASTSAGEAGAFSLLVALRPGSNGLELTARDAAGNVSRKQLTVSRQESQAAVVLELTPDSFDIADLPQTLSIVAHVVGHDGLPLDGADATFTMSAPGQMTVTHQATTDAGTASWSFPLSGDLGQTGRGLVTVSVDASGGQMLLDSGTFTFR